MRMTSFHGGRADPAAYQAMKTVRFSQVVKKAGKPTMHLQLVDAAEDRELRQAAKLNRVTTISQSTVGHATDHGTVGLDPKLKGQLLVFPKSLASFADRRVVGIKYEMLEEPEIPKDKLAPKSLLKKKTRSRGAKQSQGRAASAAARSGKAASEFEAVLRDVSRSESGTPPASKRKRGQQSQLKQESNDLIQSAIRDALQALEDGRAVKAYKILKRLVPEHEE
jgi:hypothetical protein